MSVMIYMPNKKLAIDSDTVTVDQRHTSWQVTYNLVAEADNNGVVFTFTVQEITDCIWRSITVVHDENAQSSESGSISGSARGGDN